MGAPATNDDQLQWIPTHEARFSVPGAAIDPEILLIVPGATVGVRERRKGCAAPVERFRQDRLDGCVETFDFDGVETARKSLGMKTGSEQGFVDINIAEAGDAPLIEERALEFGGAASESCGEETRSEPGLERFGAYRLFHTIELVRHQVQDAAKLALIREAEGRAVIEVEHEVLEPERRGGTWQDLKHAGHPQMRHEERVVVEGEEEVLAAAPDPSDCLADQAGAGRFDAKWPDDTGKGSNSKIGDRAAGDLVKESSTDGLYLGEFWHTANLSSHVGRGRSGSSVRQRTSSC